MDCHSDKIKSLERVPSVRSWGQALKSSRRGAGGLLPGGAVLPLTHAPSLSPEVPRPSALSPRDVPPAGAPEHCFSIPRGC